MTTGHEDLAGAERAFLIAPAGCGKTELIAKAVASHVGKPQLVLTHTHAGVSALRSRLRRCGVAAGSMSVDTIAGFALRYSASFPATSGLTEFQPAGKGWNQVYGTALKVLSDPIGRHVLTASYDGVYVDEYQDCTTDQHALVLALAEVLPCRVLGDPLQGIFGFAGKLVDWSSDLSPHFEELEPLSTPWRWLDKNPALGEWLLSIRDPLLRSDPLDLTGAPVEIDEVTQPKQVLTCYRVSARQGSVVGIRKWPNDAHEVARSLGGRFTSMEEMECNDLVKTARKFDSSSGSARALEVIEFASLCMTQVKSTLKGASAKLEKGQLPSYGSIPVAMVDALSEIAQDQESDWRRIWTALSEVRRLPKVKVFRRELLNEMHKVLRSTYDGAYESLSDAAWSIRDQARHEIRKLDHRLISRTLLVKGLEFDHCVVLKAEEWDAKSLYVAMTRGSQTLSILTANGAPVINYSGAG